MKKESPKIVSTELWTSITISLLILSVLITILYNNQIGIILALLGFITSAIPDIYNKKIRGWFFLALSTILIILFSI